MNILSIDDRALTTLSDFDQQRVQDDANAWSTLPLRVDINQQLGMNSGSITLMR
jgi:hypothetical protein